LEVLEAVQAGHRRQIAAQSSTGHETAHSVLVQIGKLGNDALKCGTTLLLLDVHLPKKSGFDVLQWVRSHCHFQSLPALNNASHPDLRRTGWACRPQRAARIGSTVFRPLAPATTSIPSPTRSRGFSAHQTKLCMWPTPFKDEIRDLRSRGAHNRNFHEQDERKIKPYVLRHLRKHECVIGHCEKMVQKGDPPSRWNQTAKLPHGTSGTAFDSRAKRTDGRQELEDFP
jgi:hypothetical protein